MMIIRGQGPISSLKKQCSKSHATVPIKLQSPVCMITFSMRKLSRIARFPMLGTVSRLNKYIHIIFTVHSLKSKHVLFITVHS